MKKAVVTGATGSIGSTLINELVDDNYFVYAIVRPNSTNIDNISNHHNIKIIPCELSDYDKLYFLINDDCDLFFHLAWNGVKREERNNEEIQKRNVDYTLQSIQLAKKLNCHVFVGAGSQAEYGPKKELITVSTKSNPSTEYGKYKLECETEGEKLAKSLNILFFFPRIFSVYGPKDNDYTMIKTVLKKMINNEDIDLTLCTQLWEYIYCEDAAHALKLIAEKGIKNTKFIVSSEDTRELKDFILRMKQITQSTSQLNFGVVKYSEGIVNLNSDISSLKDIEFKESMDFDSGIKLVLKSIKK